MTTATRQYQRLAQHARPAHVKPVAPESPLIQHGTSHGPPPSWLMATAGPLRRKNPFHFLSELMDGAFKAKNDHGNRLAYRMEAREGLRLIPARIVNGEIHLLTGTSRITTVSFIKAFLKACVGFDDYLPVHYPRVTRPPSTDGESFKWFVANERNGARFALGDLAQDTGLPTLQEPRTSAGIHQRRRN